jgi:hypothetical protein
VQAADTDSNGKISDDEAAAYKKLMAAQAEKSGETQGAHGAHGHHGGGKTDSASSSDTDLTRALDMLKQYVNNSGDSSGATAASASRTVDTSA